MTLPRGVPNLVAASNPRPSRLRSFFSPIFTFFPFGFPSGTPGGRSFRLWPGGSQAKGPVNVARSYGNVHVSVETSLQLSAVWACVWKYANVISTLPLMTMKTGEQNTATVAGQHPLYVILHDRPNANMSAAKFWQALIASMMSWGVAYARKRFVGSRLVALEPMRPEFTTVYMDANGALRYRYWPSAGPMNPVDGGEDLSADEVFVVIERTMDGFTALSRIQYAANSYGAAMAADRSSALSWKNGLRATGILTIAQWLKPDQRDAYKKIVNDFVGTGTGEDSDKQYGVMIAENATKFEALNLKPVDLELLDSRRFSVEDICRWFDIPPILIGHSADGQTMWGSGIEQIILGWLKLGLAPVLRTIEQEIWRQLLSPADRSAGIFAEFNLDALLRGDSASRATFYAQMSQNGVYTRNEIRAKENLPPVAGGDQSTVQSNLVPLDKLGTMPAPTAQLKDALREFLGIEEPK
jgi:HK97 family phage portal protein